MPTEDPTRFTQPLRQLAVRVPADAREVIADHCSYEGCTLGALVEAWAEAVASGDREATFGDMAAKARKIDSYRRSRS